MLQSRCCQGGSHLKVQLGQHPLPSSLSGSWQGSVPQFLAGCWPVATHFARWPSPRGQAREKSQSTPARQMSGFCNLIRLDTHYLCCILSTGVTRPNSQRNGIAQGCEYQEARFMEGCQATHTSVAPNRLTRLLRKCAPSGQ